MKRCLSKSEWAGLWAILWRMVVFGPILMPLGVALFLGTVVGIFAPPGYALIAFITGDYVSGLLILAGWLIFMRLTRRLRRQLLAGIEYSSL